MKKIITLVAMLGALCCYAQEQEYTYFEGDKKLACEAVLCLATGNRPDECAPSLNRYFSINPKNAADRIRARQNFLNLCPR
jgi:hypothetical protein